MCLHTPFAQPKPPVLRSVLLVFQLHHFHSRQSIDISILSSSSSSIVDTTNIPLQHNTRHNTRCRAWPVFYFLIGSILLPLALYCLLVVCVVVVCARTGSPTILLPATRRGLDVLDARVLPASSIPVSTPSRQFRRLPICPRPKSSSFDSPLLSAPQLVPMI